MQAKTPYASQVSGKVLPAFRRRESVCSRKACNRTQRLILVMACWLVQTACLTKIAAAVRLPGQSAAGMEEEAMKEEIAVHMQLRVSQRRSQVMLITILRTKWEMKTGGKMLGRRRGKRTGRRCCGWRRRGKG